MLTFMWGRCTMIYTSIRHGRQLPPRQALLFDTIPHSVKRSSVRPSSLPSPLYFHLHCHPSHVVPLILSFLILSSFVTPHIHHSIHISATSNLFSFAFFNAQVFKFIFLSHNTPDTLFQFFHPLCTMWVTSASSSPSSGNVDPTYANAFNLFTLSFRFSKCISAFWCSAHPGYSVFFLLIFNHRSPIALLNFASVLSTCTLLVPRNTVSSANSVYQGGCSLMPHPLTSNITSNR